MRTQCQCIVNHESGNRQQVIKCERTGNDLFRMEIDATEGAERCRCSPVEETMRWNTRLNSVLDHNERRLRIKTIDSTIVCRIAEDGSGGAERRECLVGSESRFSYDSTPAYLFDRSSFVRPTGNRQISKV